MPYSSTEKLRSHPFPCNWFERKRTELGGKSLFVPMTLLMVTSSTLELLSASCFPFSSFSFHSNPLGSQMISAAKGQGTQTSLPLPKGENTQFHCRISLQHFCRAQTGERDLFFFKNKHSAGKLLYMQRFFHIT